MKKIMTGTLAALGVAACNMGGTTSHFSALGTEELQNPSIVLHYDGDTTSLSAAQQDQLTHIADIYHHHQKTAYDVTLYVHGVAAACTAPLAKFVKEHGQRRASDDLGGHYHLQNKPDIPNLPEDLKKPVETALARGTLTAQFLASQGVKPDQIRISYSVVGDNNAAGCGGHTKVENANSAIIHGYVAQKRGSVAPIYF